MQDNNQQSRKDIVVDFLKLVVAGRIDEDIETRCHERQAPQPI
jgi:hypothetical protein